MWVLEPQGYQLPATLLDRSSEAIQNEYFYNHRGGQSVNGTGADGWQIVKERMKRTFDRVESVIGAVAERIHEKQHAGGPYQNHRCKLCSGINTWLPVLITHTRATKKPGLAGAGQRKVVERKMGQLKARCAKPTL